MARMSRARDDSDPFRPEVIEDPYPYYTRLRREAPCYYVKQRDVWVLSRYADIAAALRDPRVFSSSQGVGYERRPVPMMIAYDPPQHTRLRRIVAGQFTPRQAAKLAPRIEQIVDDLLTPLIDAGVVDLVECLSGPFPVTVIAEMMGIPADRRRDFKRWSDDTVTALGGAVDLSPEERMKVEASIGEFAMYFRSIIAERRERDDGESDDLISLLLRPSRDGEVLQEMEIVSFCVLLLVAGNETTTNLISNAVVALLENPDQWQEARRLEHGVEALVEEALRYDSPIQGFFRNTLSEVEVAGVTIPAGAKVMVLYGSANRDASRFPDPDAFRVERHPEDHLAFGWGPHTCLGAHVARLEARTLARAFLERVGAVRLEGVPERTQNPLLRGFESLPVAIEGR
jgi:cytochrome P450